MKLRIFLVGVGIVIALIVAGRVIAQPPGSGPEEVAIDTTGETAGARSVGEATNGATVGTPAAQATQAALPTAATPVSAPTAVPTPARPTATPVVVQVQGTPINVERKPLLLLNPSTVRQGSNVGVTGSGFDAGATVDILLKQNEQDKGEAITFVQLDKSGGFGGVGFAVPDTLPRGTLIVEAHQRQSDKLARARVVIAGGSPQVKVGTQVGKPGDVVQLSAQGFGPDEEVKVFWNGLGGKLAGSLRTDGSGGIREGAVRVPFGAVGNNSFVFVGDKSQSPVTINFLMLNLFPTVELSSYAIKPDNVLSFAAKDFGPDERVLVYLNSPEGSPLTIIQANAEGGFGNAGGFVVPFGLRGKQTLIFVGEQSRAPTTASFDILPYTPSAQPSTYGGRPGTTVTFYGVGFARKEVVHVFLGRTRDNPGRLVSCFRTDDQGNAGAAGSFVVPGDIQAGQLIFTLVGTKSEASGTAAMEVIPSDVAVQVPSQGEFKCSLDEPTPQVPAAPAATAEAPAPQVPAAPPATAEAPAGAPGQ